MPFSQQEIDLLKSAKSRGLDQNQALEALNAYRTTVMNAPPIGQPAPKEATDAQKLLNAEPKKKGFLGKIIGSASSGTGIVGIGEGILQGLGRTFAGAAELGTHAGQWVGEKLGTNPNGVTQGPTISSDLNQLLTPVTGAQKFGFGAEKVGEFVAPANIVGKATKGIAAARNLGKVGTVALDALGQGAVGAGVASVQEGKVGDSAVVSGAIGAGFPIAGAAAGAVIKPAKALVGRLITNLSASLAGKPANVIRAISGNTKASIATKNMILNSGQESVLKKNVSTIMDGISAIRKEASSKYGSAVEALSKADINPQLVKENGLKSLERAKISIKGGKINLSNAEFSDPKNIKKAKDLINMVNNVKSLDGKTFRKLIDSVESAAYTTATNDERLSFNAFVRDMAKSMKDAVNKSTPILDEANKAFTKDMQLVEGMEGIFGKVKFKNTSEINTIARKLETLFGKQGLDPSTIESFLKRVGVKPEDFYASEAVRQLSTSSGKNIGAGLSTDGILKSTTGAMVTPSLVGDITMKAGKASETISKARQMVKPRIGTIANAAILAGQASQIGQNIQNNFPRSLVTGSIQAGFSQAVSELKQSGITNPVQIMQILNYDENGRKINSFTEKEVIDMLKGKDPYKIVEDSPMPGAPPEPTTPQ